MKRERSDEWREREPRYQGRPKKIKHINKQMLYYYMTDAETRTKRLDKLRQYEFEAKIARIKKNARFVPKRDSHSSNELKDNGIEATKRIKREDSMKNSSEGSTRPKAEIIDLVEEEEDDILGRLTPPLPGIEKPINGFVVIDESTAELKEDNEDEDVFERSTPPLPKVRSLYSY